ncbi:MAG: hypothetical protein KC800_05155 [Candidatus Eremiobacteraeota bacterium]|nr:hypothetical protein [Candidatus Eremiobacteraeota bacterium]
MRIPLPIAALTALLTCSLFLGGLAQNFEEATWTLDETPTQKQAQIDPQPLLDVPEPLRKLFPMLDKIESEVGFGLKNGNVSSLLGAVKDLTQAEYFAGIQGGGSERLLREATDLAWEQRDPEGLRDALALWSSPNRAGRNQEMILQTSERLEQVEKERSEMLQKKRCRIIFHNRTDRSVQVFVNRKPVGILPAGEKHEVGELLAGRQYLGVEDESLQWGPRKVYVGPGEVFNCRLFD